MELLSEPGRGRFPVAELNLDESLNWETFFKMDCKLLQGAED